MFLYKLWASDKTIENFNIYTISSLILKFCFRKCGLDPKHLSFLKASDVILMRLFGENYYWFSGFHYWYIVLNGFAFNNLFPHYPYIIYKFLRIPNLKNHCQINSPFAYFYITPSLDDKVRTRKYGAEIYQNVLLLVSSCTNYSLSSSSIEFSLLTGMIYIFTLLWLFLYFCISCSHSQNIICHFFCPWKFLFIL